MIKDKFESPAQWTKNPEEYYDSNPPEISFIGGRFILTGCFALSYRDYIIQQIKQVGGKVSNKPTKSECYLVVGTLPSSYWITSDAGKKLLAGLELREEGYFVYIVSEDHFISELLKAQEKYKEQIPLDYIEPKISYDRHILSWINPLLEEFPINLSCRERVDGLTVHLTEKTSKILFKMKYNHLSYKIKFQVAGSPYTEIDFKRNLPSEIFEKLKIVFAEMYKIQNSINLPKKEKTPKLSTDELKRRNAERKAVMRAKPVTSEVLLASQQIITFMAEIAPSKKIIGKDLTKFYVIGYEKGQVLCILHYKTSNKYIEFKNKNKFALTEFSEWENYKSDIKDILIS